VVEGSVRGETGCVVHLQQEHSLLIVHHEVKSQQLEAHVAPRLLRPAQTIVANKLRLGCQYRFHDAILHLRPVGVSSEPHFLKILEELGEGLFVAVAEVVGGVVVLVVGVGLVDGVVGQMHVEVIQVALGRQLVGLSRKPHQSFVVEVYSERVSASNEHIDAQIELQSLEEQRVRHILLHHAFLLLLQFRRVLREIYSPSLASRLGFHNKGFSEAASSGFSEVVVNLGGVVGEEEGAWEEVVVEGELILHASEGEGEGVLAADDAHGGEVIDALVGCHPLESLIDHPSVAPFQLPRTSLSKVLHSKPKRLRADLLKNGVLCDCIARMIHARLMVMLDLLALRPIISRSMLECFCLW
jgi:hypothetical protein